MEIIKRIALFIDRFTDKLGIFTSWCTTTLVVLVSLDVISRYIFQFSSVAVQELEWHIFAVIFLLGASYTLKTDKHVRVDILYSRLSAKHKAIIDIAGILLFLIPFCLLIIYSSVNFVFNSFLINESSPDPGGLPFRFLIKALLPVSFVFLLLQAFSMLIHTIDQILPRGRN